MIYLLGASGYIGQAYQQFFKGRQIPFRAISRSDLAYHLPGTLERDLRAHRPEFLINVAGFTGKPNVDACEIHRQECLAANAVLPGIIAGACAATGTPWAHLSSGCIYTGTRTDGTGFTEEDVPNFTFRNNNCSFYSGCKALGEEVLAGQPQCYVWRVRIPFSQKDHPRNYLTKLMTYPKLLQARNSLSCLEEFIPASFECWIQRLPFGIYHLTNPGSILTQEVVDLIQFHGLSKKRFEYFESESEFMRVAAVTPRSNCVLDSSKIQQSGIRLSEVHEAVDQALRSWQPHS